MTVIDTQTVDERIQADYNRKAALYEKHPRYGISLADLEKLDNEQQIAELCAKFYKGHYLYDVSAGAWYRYTGLIWQRITNVSEFHNVVAKDLMALFTWGASKAIEVHEDREKAGKQYGALMELAKEAGTKRFLEEVTHFLTGLPNMAVDGGAWDAQAHLLVCANAIIDLRTGEDIEPFPQQCLQKSARADWTGMETPCPLSIPSPNWR